MSVLEREMFVSETDSVLKRDVWTLDSVSNYREICLC